MEKMASYRQVVLNSLPKNYKHGFNKLQVGASEDSLVNVLQIAAYTCTCRVIKGIISKLVPLRKVIDHFLPLWHLNSKISES